MHLGETSVLTSVHNSHYVKLQGLSLDCRKHESSQVKSCTKTNVSPNCGPRTTGCLGCPPKGPVHIILFDT
jgi:hypothetical protein